MLITSQLKSISLWSRINYSSMKKTLRISMLLAAFLCTAIRGNAQAVYSTMDFSLPEMQWRPIPLWFWNNATVEGDVLEQQLEQMVTTDYYGGCAILPFGASFRPSYLSTDYFNLYGRAIAKARELGAHMSLYDEYGFPSGSMGASNGNGVPTFKNNHPEHTIKRLDKTESSLSSGSHLSRTITYSGKLMSLVAWNNKTNEIVNLRDKLNSENRLEWDVPEGSWRLLIFQCVIDGDPDVDYLSSESVSLFVNDTHGAYYSQFPDAFGETIISTFYDEPSTCYAQGRMWTNDFNEKFQARYGFSPETLYPALWYNIGPGTAAARCLLFSMHSELYSYGFMGTIGRWAEEHGIQATGHQLWEEVANATCVAGDLMLDGKYVSMPGIDKIGGPVGTENFYKVVSSSANNWDKDYVMSETYGAMGNIPTETMYQVAIEQYTKGINHLIPHAVWYNDQNVTYLPELSWRNPLYNTELPRFNRFLARLNYLLARPGRHVADMAVLYPIQTQYAGHYFGGPKSPDSGGVDVPGTDYPIIARNLTDYLGVDFTFLHPEVLDDRCSISDGCLLMNNKTNWESFSTIILPGVKTISMSNMKKIEAAWEAGATIIFTTQKPSECADFDGDDTQIQAIVERILSGEEGCGKARFVSSPSAQNLGEALNLRPVAPDVTFKTDGEPLNYLHKVIGGHDVYYFGNIDASAFKGTISLRTPLQNATLMNPHTGECFTPDMRTGENGRQEFDLQLWPNQSMFLVDDVLLEKNGTNEEVSDLKLSYTIEATILIEKLSGSICFSSTDDRNFYMWQFNVSEPTNPRLRPHRWMGGSATAMGDVSLPQDARIARSKAFNVKIEVSEEQYARTYINDVFVDERAGTFTYGRIGFRQSHDPDYNSEESARYDNVRITMGDGRVLFSSSFNGINPFTAGTVMSGWLRVLGNMSTDIYAWLKELPDGIEEVRVPYRYVPSTQMWNLSGMSLPAIPSHQIYIRDGRKVLAP